MRDRVAAVVILFGALLACGGSAGLERAAWRADAAGEVTLNEQQA